MAISYPVNADSRWTFKTGGQTYRNKRWPREDLGPIDNAAPDLVILEQSVGAEPPYDEATEKLEWGWVDDPAANTAVWTASVVPKTAEEQAEYARQQDIAAKQAQAKAVYTDLKNGVGTAGERATRLERVVAWMLKREFSDLD